MNNYIPLEGSEQKCGVCGKIIYVSGKWVYFCKNKKHKVYCCSYSCMRKSELETGTKRNYIRTR